MHSIFVMAGTYQMLHVVLYLQLPMPRRFMFKETLLNLIKQAAQIELHALRALLQDPNFPPGIQIWCREALPGVNI